MALDRARVHPTYMGSLALVFGFLLLSTLFGRQGYSNTASVASREGSTEQLTWPLAVQYEIRNTEGLISEHRFTGSSWDAWTDQEAEGTEGACLTLLDSGELVGQSLGCAGAYFVVNDGREAEMISPNGEFRPLDRNAIDTVQTTTELGAVNDVVSALDLKPAQLVTTASSIQIPCPAVLDLRCVADERVARDRIVVADRVSGIPLRVEYLILGEVVHSVTVTSVEPLQSYEPDPAAVEAAAAGTALEDVLDFR